MNVLRVWMFAGLACVSMTASRALAETMPEDPLAAPSASIRLMAFNIEWGGTHVSFDKVVEAIREAGPDIVAVQEAEGNLARLAAELGWNYDLRNHVIARHPLIDPPGANGTYVLAEVHPGRVVAVANVHLPSDPYGEDWIRDGRKLDEILALEQRVRLPAVRPFLEALPPLAAAGLPVFLAGDFNSPSHEDWGPTAIERWPFRRFSVGWPVAKAVHSAGFRDSYRRVHPDPLRHPGFTWWAGRPKIADYNPGPPDSWQSRIDFIWYAGPVEVTRSILVGEREAPGVTIAVTPWPSDHRAVVSDFSLEPAAMPILVAASKRLYRSGDRASLVFNNRTSAGALVVAPATAGSGRTGIWRRFRTAAGRGNLELDELPAAPGKYVVALEDSDGRTVSRNEFWVSSADAMPEIEILGESYAQEEPLSVRWRNAPGNRYDWVVVHAEGAVDRDAYVAWAHTGARIEGEIALRAAHAVGGWPLAPGRYVASLMADDGFQLLATSKPFEIREP